MSGLASGTQQTIMSDSDKTPGRHMHQESANELNAGDGMFFPPAFFPVIFHIVGNGILIHTDNTMVTDGNPVGILSKVVNNGLCTVKGFLAVRNPVLVITKVQKFLESIMITILFAASVELKFFIFPEGFEFGHVFTTEQL